ncbi:leucyl/phenylalanyl-tRNA--protein transferase [Jannaschia rubra]|uniref:Leucyl/phenylalanyl-tRNA--protein transferase n=1 Tax=Jannaschia rubra TaxID=282197 RepID=A0A0M6XLY7_9RHOB|nr:leucyl/phenylalanyl-tRNA--protein transferase [Jannaschia rubra]CTQ32109.1 Leucyl/phenylalanyl-tRNA--protein transferase [Jannaschia rubra]SFG37415.1 leucyl/phenylalanyl-tRNA--protein transferase [Jannaschia rubra]
MPRDTTEITSDLLLSAYASGVFPMAERRDDPDIFWVDPRRRGILPLDGFRMSRSLSRVIGRGRFGVTLNADFAGVLDGCADREETWINPGIAALYADLHARGFAHSLEIWDGEVLAGGVYGVTLGAAFFGESMFSRRTDASKVALAYMVTLLRRQGFMLFDTQFLTDHLASLGGIEITRAAYHDRLRDALARTARLEGPVPDQSAVRHLRSQTS